MFYYILLYPVWSIVFLIIIIIKFEFYSILGQCNGRNKQMYIFTWAQRHFRNFSFIPASTETHCKPFLMFCWYMCTGQRSEGRSGCYCACMNVSDCVSFFSCSLCYNSGFLLCSWGNSAHTHTTSPGLGVWPLRALLLVLKNQSHHTFPHILHWFHFACVRRPKSELVTDVNKMPSCVSWSSCSVAAAGGAAGSR